MMINYEGKDIKIEFHSCNNNMILLICDSTKMKNDYLYNVFSCDGFLDPKHIFVHKKLKIYYNKYHGYYVKCQNVRCYCNGLIKKLKESK